MDSLPKVVTKKNAQRALQRIKEEISQTSYDTLQAETLEVFIVDMFRHEITSLTHVGRMAADQLSLIEGPSSKNGETGFVELNAEQVGV